MRRADATTLSDAECDAIAAAHRWDTTAGRRAMLRAAAAPRPRGRPTVQVDMARARELLAAGDSVRTVAARLGVSDFTLRKRLRGQKDFPGER